MGKEKEKLILDRKIEEALRKGAKPEEHSSALPPYGFYIPSDASPIPGPTEPWVYAMHELPLFPVLLKKPICTSCLPTWQAKEVTLSLIAWSGTSLATSSSQTSFADNASSTKRRNLWLLKTRKGKTQNGPLNAGKSSSRHPA